MQQSAEKKVRYKTHINTFNKYIIYQKWALALIN